MFKCAGGGGAPSWGALQEALLDKVGFNYVFYGVGGFSDGGGDVV